jgi:hypothetical protein
MNRDSQVQGDPRAQRGDRLTTVVAVAIALVSMASVGVVWRATIAQSSATTLEREGVIEAVKREAALGADISTLLWETRHAADHALYSARLGVLEGDDDSAAIAEAEGLALIVDALADFTPLATDPAYRTADGGFDLDARLADLRDLNPDLRDLDPSAQFDEADRYHLESRLLLSVVVVFSVSLFFLTLAEITVRRVRYLLASVGGLVFLLGAGGAVAAELYCAISFLPAG